MGRLTGGHAFLGAWRRASCAPELTHRLATKEHKSPGTHRAPNQHSGNTYQKAHTKTKRSPSQLYVLADLVFSEVMASAGEIPERIPIARRTTS